MNPFQRGGADSSLLMLALGAAIPCLLWAIASWAIPRARAAYARRPSARAREAKMRRARYEELKQLISSRHFEGYAGLTIEDPKFDRLDMASFGPPMYGYVRNAKMQWCIFWDRDRMTRDIGVGAPLRDGEVIAPSAPVQSSRPQLWKKTAEEVDEQKTLTQMKGPPPGDHVLLIPEPLSLTHRKEQPDDDEDDPTEV